MGIHGAHDVIRMSCVAGGADGCPGLVGPSEMARWGVVMDFFNKRMEIKGSWQPMALTASRHPAVHLLDFGDLTSPFWDQDEIQEKVKLLQRAPQSWAFNADEVASEEDEESDEGWRRS